MKKGKKSTYHNKDPDTNDKTNHNDDLLIVLDVDNLTSDQNSDAFFNPKKFFSQQHENVLVLDEEKLKQYNNDIYEAINDKIKKQMLDTKKINNVKVIDIQHSCPRSGRVEVHNNDMCVNLVKAINKCFPDIKRTKLISTSCHSETVDKKEKDLRVELYNAVNGIEWKQQHKLDLYLTPFNEIDGKFKLNQEGKKIKQHIRLMNTKLAPSLGDDMTTEQKQYAQNMLQFMMNGQVYSYIKDTDGKAKMSLHIREYEPDNTEEEKKYKFVSLKRKKTEKDQGKKTLKNYCTLKEMSEFLQEYYQQCEKQINEYFDKYPSKEDAKMKNKLVDLKYLSLYREKIEKADIIKNMGQKWYDDKLEECKQKKEEEFKQQTSGTIFNPEPNKEEKQIIKNKIDDKYNEDEYVKKQFISQKVEQYKQSLQNKSLSEQEKTRASKAIALDEGLKDIIGLKGKHVMDMECYLPRKIENVQIENDSDIVYNQSQKDINNSQIKEKNENDITYESQNEKKKEMNNSLIETEGKNIGAGCNCDKCCSLFNSILSYH
ncbi:MAG: hypothetical protein IJT15_03865 [Rickettsiales bacterium]|nr:hypothetical protein [Rickettsiales bacterium]